MITIASLIYRSRRYADALWDSLLEFTPQLATSEARMLFIANNPEPELLAHLQVNGYPHVVHRTALLSDEEMKREGFAKPTYMRAVYSGYNRAIEEATERVVLVNSDHLFSPGWLDALIRESSPQRIVCSQLVERRHHKYGVFPRAIEGEFGDHPDRFLKGEFMRYAQAVARPGMTAPGGAYMPCMFYRDQAIAAGLYPLGNPIVNGKRQYGDIEFFLRLATAGVEHVTALDSIVYHFKEGEMSE